MWPRSRSKSGQAGFTLIEATISMTLLVVVLVVSLSFLFSMRTFSQRQELTAQPRQTARRALDYVAYYVRGASDLNARKNNPNAIVVWFDNSGVNRQASYNNLTGSEVGNGTVDADTTTFGDVGTDLISLAVPPLWPMNIQYSPVSGSSSTGDAFYSVGCPDDALNFQMFKDATGCCDSSGNSPILTLTQPDGTWAYFQITGYQQSACPDGVHITANHGNSLGINPPGGPPLTEPYFITGGTTFLAFRIFQNQLQQHRGFFNPTTPSTDWTTLLGDMEDLQVAYIFNDGTIWNRAGNTMTTTGQVPTQVYDSTAATDISQVVGLRVSVTARSAVLPTFRPGPVVYQLRPAAEDHAGQTQSQLGTDRYLHDRITATVMLRNRMLGS